MFKKIQRFKKATSLFFLGAILGIAVVGGFFFSTETTRADFCVGQNCAQNFDFKHGNPVNDSFVAAKPPPQKYWVRENQGSPNYCVTKKDSNNKRCVHSIKPPVLEMIDRGTSPEANAIPITFRLYGETDSWWYARNNSDSSGVDLSRFPNSGGLTSLPNSFQYCPCVSLRSDRRPYGSDNTGFHSSCDVTSSNGISYANTDDNSPAVCYDAAYVQVENNGDRWVREHVSDEKRFRNRDLSGLDNVITDNSSPKKEEMFKFGGRCGCDKKWDVIDCDETPKGLTLDYDCYDEYKKPVYGDVNKGDAAVYAWRYRRVEKVRAFKIEELVQNGSRVYTPASGVTRTGNDFELRYVGKLLPNQYDAVEDGTSIASNETSHACNIYNSIKSVSSLQNDSVKGSYRDYEIIVKAKTENLDANVSICDKETVTTSDCRSSCDTNCGVNHPDKSTCYSNCDTSCSLGATKCKLQCNSAFCGRKVFGVGTATINPTAGATCRATLISPIGLKSSYVYYTGSAEIPEAKIKSFEVAAHDDAKEKVESRTTNTSQSIALVPETVYGQKSARVVANSSPNESFKVEILKDSTDVVLKWDTEFANLVTLRKNDDKSDQIEVRDELSGSRTFKNLSAGQTYSFVLIAQNDRADKTGDLTWVKAQRINIEITKVPLVIHCNDPPAKKFKVVNLEPDDVEISWKTTGANRIDLEGQMSWLRCGTKAPCFTDSITAPSQVKEGSLLLKNIDSGDTRIKLIAKNAQGQTAPCEFHINQPGRTVGFPDLMESFENGIRVANKPLVEYIPGVHCSYLVVATAVSVCNGLSIDGLITKFAAPVIGGLISGIFPGLGLLGSIIANVATNLIMKVGEGLLGLLWGVIDNFVLHHNVWDASGGWEVILSTVKGGLISFVGSVISSFLGDVTRCIDMAVRKAMGDVVLLLGNVAVGIGDLLGEIGKYVPGVGEAGGIIKQLGTVIATPPSALVGGLINSAASNAVSSLVPSMKEENPNDAGYLTGSLIGESVGTIFGDSIAEGIANAIPGAKAVRETLKNVVFPLGSKIPGVGNACPGPSTMSTIYNWRKGEFGECNATCPEGFAGNAEGTRIRSVTCGAPPGEKCQGDTPASSEKCSILCVKVNPPKQPSQKKAIDKCKEILPPNQCVVQKGAATNTNSGNQNRINFGRNVMQAAKATIGQQETAESMHDLVNPTNAKEVEEYTATHGMAGVGIDPGEMTEAQRNAILCIGGGWGTPSDCHEKYNKYDQKIPKVNHGLY